MERIADNLHALCPGVARALADRDPGPLANLARRLARAGADRLDLNPGYLPARRADAMAFFVDAVQAVTDLPLVLDSPRADVLAAGLARCQRPPILDALTAEPARLAEVLPLAAARDLDLVLLLVDARSQVPPCLDEKVALALELVEAAGAAGLGPARLIVDPVLPNLRWPDAAAQLDAAVEVVRLFASGALLGEPLRTMAGLSNLRSGLRHQIPAATEAAALARLEAAGLTYALCDVLAPRPGSRGRGRLRPDDG